MVRGTYFPCPVWAVNMHSVLLVVAVKLAGLREESAEPLIWLGGLALLGEVSIWL